jgi:MFS family permease
VVFFFTFQLESVALVGVFLGVANAIAFFLDIPVGILQRYYSTKKLFIVWAVSQMIAVGIFFNFIYDVFSLVEATGETIIPDGFSSVWWWFFGNALNWVLILIASFCYGLTKEINDISTFGYILSHAHPSEYGKILARNNITYGLGSLTGLILSGFILSVNPTFAVIVLWGVIVGFLTFTIRFFDNAMESVTLQDITSFTIGIKKINKENISEYISEKIHAVDLEKVIQTAKYVFLKPRQKIENPLKWSALIIETRKNALIIKTIMLHTPVYMIIYWTMSLVLIFGFWDTFASTFLIEFLAQIGSEKTAYILLAIIAIPALGLQELAGKMAEKLGIKTIAMLGLGLSGWSLIAMAIMSIGYDGGLGSRGLILMGLALVNSIGYACGMALGQNQFLDGYNKIYASTMNLKEIDSNASAWPMKILQNAANVIGLVLGGFILQVLGYAGFFIVFGLIILGVLGWSIQKKDEIPV